MGYSNKTRKIASQVVKDGNQIILGNSKILALHTPGHTEDSIVFLSIVIYFLEILC